MTTRRRFLHTALVGTITAPLVAQALIDHKRKPVNLDDFKVNWLPGPPGRLVRVQGRAILVPSNRVSVRYDRYVDRPPQANPAWVWYRGDWDGTFKMERGCSNPAYILLDLTIHGAVLPEDMHVVMDLKAIYNWGVYCDKMIAGVMSRTEEPMWTQRFTVNPVVSTEADRAKLQAALEIHFKEWKAFDSHYRAVWRGGTPLGEIPY